MRRLSDEEAGEASRLPPREQAEWRAKKLSGESERTPLSYGQYLVRP